MMVMMIMKMMMVMMMMMVTMMAMMIYLCIVDVGSQSDGKIAEIQKRYDWILRLF